MTALNFLQAKLVQVMKTSLSETENKALELAFVHFARKSFKIISLREKIPLGVLLNEVSFYKFIKKT